MENMFCYQCEQTAAGKGCCVSGVCGKKPDVSALQDELTGALIALARATDGSAPTDETNSVLLDGLFATVTNVNFDAKALRKIIEHVSSEEKKYVPSGEYDLTDLWSADADVKSLKSLLLFGIRGISAYAYHAHALGYDVSMVTVFLYKALRVIGNESLGMKELLPIVLECGKANLDAMEVLDKANTETYGNPVPTTVPLSIEPGPFIVISGHDLHDLKLLLEQTEGKGVNVYTHSEMLPAHGYPELKKYAHLKGNFGTAWQNQQKEFADIPAPILFTTNCLMPPKSSYADRVFTTSVVSYPELVHIGADKDFTPVIEKAL
jgi:hydroxylamine reductase